MKLPFRRIPQEPTARVVRDEWLEWLRLSAFSPLTIKGYRLTSDKLLERWPDLSLAEFTDEHIVGMIDEVKPASRQSRRSCFQNLFGWAYRTKRIPFNPMVHVPTLKTQPHAVVEVFTDAECKILCSLPEPDGTLMWGCAYSRCLNAARFVVKGPDGYEYGACAAHVRAVKGIANAR